MPVPPQRPVSSNPIRDVVGRAREIAGHAAGGSLTENQQRMRPAPTGRRLSGSGSLLYSRTGSFAPIPPISIAGGTDEIVSISGGGWVGNFHWPLPGSPSAPNIWQVTVSNVVVYFTTLPTSGEVAVTLHDQISVPLRAPAAHAWQETVSGYRRLTMGTMTDIIRTFEPWTPTLHVDNATDVTLTNVRGHFTAVQIP